MQQQLGEIQRSPYRLSEYLRRYVWLAARLILIRPSPNRAYAWRRFWLKVFGAKIGCQSSIRPSTRVLHPWLLVMGENSLISDRVNVYNLGPLHISSNTVVSQDAHLCGGTHDYHDPKLPLVKASITIGPGVWVCAEAFIGPGVTIGENAVVGARAVVTKDVPPGMVVAGNPAKVIKPRTFHTQTNQ